MDFVKGLRDLEVYKLARQLSKEIFEISMSAALCGKSTAT